MKSLIILILCFITIIFIAIFSSFYFDSLPDNYKTGNSEDNESEPD